MGLKQRKEDFIKNLVSKEIIFPIVITNNIDKNDNQIVATQNYVDKNILEHSSLGLNFYDAFIYGNDKVFNWDTGKFVAEIMNNTSKSVCISNSYYDECFSDKDIIRLVLTKDMLGRIASVAKYVSTKMGLSIYYNDKQIDELVESKTKEEVIKIANICWINYSILYRNPTTLQTEMSQRTRQILTDCAIIHNLCKSEKALVENWEELKKLLTRYEIQEYITIPYYREK